tara:strand:- start:340 stop:1437 length:1098 start_codon:yes stop_codon:yes gene_type:complete
MAYFDSNDPVANALKEKFEEDAKGPTISLDSNTNEFTLGGKKNPNASDWRKAYSDFMREGGTPINTPQNMSATKMYQHPLFAGMGLSGYSQAPYSKGFLADMQGNIAKEETAAPVSDQNVTPVVRRRVSEQTEQFGDDSSAPQTQAPDRTSETNYGWLSEDQRSIGHMLSVLPGGALISAGMYANQADAIRSAYGQFGSKVSALDMAKQALPESVKKFFNIEDDLTLNKMIFDMENKNISGRKTTDPQGVITYDYTYTYGDVTTDPMSQTQWSEQQSLLDRLSEQQAFFSEDEAGEEDQFGSFDLSETFEGEDTDVETGGSAPVGGSDAEDASGEGDDSSGGSVAGDGSGNIGGTGMGGMTGDIY